MAFGLKISKKEYDAKDADLRDLVLSSGKNLFKIKSEGAISITLPAGQMTATQVINHGLGYIPSFTVYLDSRDSNGEPIAGKRERTDREWGAYGSHIAHADSTNLTVQITNSQDPTGRTWEGYYFIFHDQLPT